MERLRALDGAMGRWLTGGAIAAPLMVDGAMFHGAMTVPSLVDGAMGVPSMERWVEWIDGRWQYLWWWSRRLRRPVVGTLVELLASVVVRSEGFVPDRGSLALAISSSAMVERSDGFVPDRGCCYGYGCDCSGAHFMDCQAQASPISIAGWKDRCCEWRCP